jgi:hypothetical protein
MTENELSIILRQNYNIAIACGEYIVVDIDPRNQGMENLNNLFRAYGKFPHTLSATSGSKGLHYYFKNNYEIRTTKLILNKQYQGIDIQSYNSYVVAPPSKHVCGNNYEWNSPPNDTEILNFPDWLFELISKEKNKKKITEYTDQNKITPIKLSDNHLEIILSALYAISPDCDYSTWITIGMSLHSMGLPFKYFDNWSSLSKSKYSSDVTLKKWVSFQNHLGNYKLITIGTLFFIAKNNYNWVEPNSNLKIIINDILSLNL